MDSAAPPTENFPGVSIEARRKLAQWALGPDCLVPDDVLAAGVGAILDRGIQHAAESVAARFWQSASAAVGWPGERTAARVLKSLVTERDWRHGWAIAALRALDERSTLDAPGLLLAIEFARARLFAAPTLIQCWVEAAGRGADPEERRDRPLTLDESPFGLPVVQEVLRALDAVVALQEATSGRREAIFVDLANSCVIPIKQARAELRARGQAVQAELLLSPRRVGFTVAFLLRYFSEEAEGRNDVDSMLALNGPILSVAARYGTTADYLLARARTAAVRSRSKPGQNARWIVFELEHARLAAEWLGDREAEAAILHVLFFLMRDFVRKAPGVLDGVGYIQRAMLLHKQLGETISALGAQVDLASLLVQWGSLGALVDDAPEEIAHWPDAAEAYLHDAIQQLALLQADARARAYLAEAYYNRAMLHLRLERPAEAEQDALAGVGIANTVGDAGLLARLMHVLGQASDDPEESVRHGLSAVEVLQRIRRGIRDEDVAVGWVNNKTQLFETQLGTLLRQAGRGLDEERACELLLASLELSRGLTYNRWLGADPVVRVDAVREALAADPTVPVLAVYVVARDQVGLVLFDRGAPQLRRIPMTPHQVTELVGVHFRGLLRQARLPGLALWPRYQAAMTGTAWRLVEPLEPYIAAGRPICVIPHRALHGAPFAVLPTEPGGVPIGLRAPVFQNPSVTNWLVARATDGASGDRALVAATASADELADFAEHRRVISHLEGTGLPVATLTPEQTTVAALGAGAPWRILHLACHGLFRAPRPEVGLLLASGGALPPAPRGEPDTSVGDHLATPHRLRDAGASARLVFLASCLSARNEEYPGDDLMGITRAFFASGSADLIAGAWTVVSSVVGEFVDQFYGALVRDVPTAEAMLVARREVAKSHPDPFHWGAFVHQGANLRVLAGGTP